MACGTLYTYPENFRAYKVLIAAKYSGANVKVDEDFEFGITEKTDAFLKKFPLGHVPAFETSGGKYLSESNAISYYVANDSLRGLTDLEKAETIQWQSFADNELLPASCSLVFSHFGVVKSTDGDGSDMETLKRALTYLNSYLLTKTYLVAERITLADISVMCTLLFPYQLVLDPAIRKPFQNINRWFTTMINQPNVKAVIGAYELCGQCSSKPKSDVREESKPEKQDEKKAKKEKKKEPKPATPKAKKAQVSEPEPEEELDATEEALAAEPKSKDPFEAYPKSATFKMDDFKKVYSNENESVSVPYFWEHFDSEAYSIWYGEYIYNEELAKVFMSCNLIMGMFQRLDKMRKNAFASMCLFGGDNNSTISGVWFWKGHDLAFQLSPDWQVDYESYKWTKLDPALPSTKEMVNNYFTWSGKDEQGRPFNQGKIFK